MKMNYKKTETTLIWDGLLNSDRETLSIFIALFEDSKGLSLVSDKILDVKSKTQKLYENSFSKSETQVMPDDIKDHFSQRIEKTAKTIYESDLSDEVLKTALWEHLLNALQLNNDDFMSPRDITRHCDDIANCMVQNATVQKNKETQTFSQKINPFKKTKSDTLSFEDAVEYLVSKITKEDIEQDANIISGIKQEISTLDNQIIQESDVSNLTEGAISKTLVTSGSLLGLMGGVQADIYCYFTELNNQITKNGGIWGYITSNKWMRANYGEGMRKMLLNNNKIDELVDLGANVFADATVDSNILIASNEKVKNYTFKAGTKLGELNEFDVNNLSDEIFNVNVSIDQIKLKQKIETVGKPLKDWDIEIRRGILTGLNDAFIISTETRNKILNNCENEDERTRTEKLIQKVLRGRDIKRYTYDWADLWLINSHNGYKNVDAIDVVNDYPSVYKHLLQYEKKASKRGDKGKHWTNLRNCAYLDEFEKEKIIYPNMTKFMPFIYADYPIYTNQKCFILCGKDIKFITSIFNSKFFDNFYRQIFPELQGGTRELNKVIFETVCIPKPNNQNMDIVQRLETLCDEMHQLHTDTQNNQNIINENDIEINNLVYKLYKLTEEEINIIENME